MSLLDAKAKKTGTAIEKGPVCGAFSYSAPPERGQEPGQLQWPCETDRRIPINTHGLSYILPT